MLPLTVLFPKISGNDGSSTGLSGAATSTSLPFTLSSSRMGPSECYAETVSMT
jgi:hypothetical protein